MVSNRTRPVIHKVIFGGGGGGEGKFVPVIATLPILGLKFIKLFVVRFYEQFHGFYALKAVGKSTSRNLFRYGGLHLEPLKNVKKNAILPVDHTGEA